MFTEIRKWINNNKLILLLVIIGTLILAYPLFALGIEKSFYLSIDPDVVYVTNALLYTKYAIITYMDHPGTPSILLFSYSYIPLRLILKYIFHQDFIQWAFDNYAFLTFYLRILQLLISGITLFLFLNLAKSINKSKLVILTAFFLIFATGVLSSSLYIGPEPASLLLTSIWLALFIKFNKTQSYRWIFLIVFVSGIAFANKLTNLFLVVPAIFLPLFIRDLKLRWKFILFEANCAIFAQAFLLGIWPIRNGIPSIIDWSSKLLNHAGRYGTGISKIIDWNSYSNSVGGLIHGYPIIFLFIIFTTLLLIILAVRKRIGKGDRTTAFLFFTSLLGFFIFAKYPAVHYNYVNIMLMVFCAVYFVNKIKTTWLKVLLPVLILASIFTTGNYFTLPQKSIQNSQSKSVYIILKSWTPHWSADIFREQLNAVENPKP